MNINVKEPRNLRRTAPEATLSSALHSITSKGTGSAEVTL